MSILNFYTRPQGSGGQWTKQRTITFSPGQPSNGTVVVTIGETNDHQFTLTQTSPGAATYSADRDFSSHDWGVGTVSYHHISVTYDTSQTIRPLSGTLTHGHGAHGGHQAKKRPDDDNLDWQASTNGPRH